MRDLAQGHHKSVLHKSGAKCISGPARPDSATGSIPDKENGNTCVAACFWLFSFFFFMIMYVKEALCLPFSDRKVPCLPCSKLCFEPIKLAAAVYWLIMDLTVSVSKVEVKWGRCISTVNVFAGNFFAIECNALSGKVYLMILKCSWYSSDNTRDL